MALKATIFKADLQITDLNRNYYQGHNLTIARHPSETDERMMVRLLAFAQYASEDLAFTKGLSTDDEPDLWQKSLSDEIECWIDLGQPDEKRIRKACGRAKQVVIYTYGGGTAEIWWEQNQEKLTRFKNLTIINLPVTETQALAQLAERNMSLQCTIQDNQLWFSNDADNIEVNPAVWRAAEK